MRAWQPLAYLQADSRAGCCPASSHRPAPGTPPHPTHRRGVLPNPATLAWPEEPFLTQFLQVLKQLEMPRFTR